MSTITRYWGKGEWTTEPFTPNGNEAWDERDLRAVGYESRSRFGEEDGVSLEVWSHRSEAGYIIFLDLDGGVSDVTYCHGNGAYRAYLQEHGFPLLRQALEIALALERQTILKRAFQAWHGHTPEDACPQCDREEMELRRYRQEAAEERRRAQDRRAALKDQS